MVADAPPVPGGQQSLTGTFRLVKSAVGRGIKRTLTSGALQETRVDPMDALESGTLGRRPIAERHASGLVLRIILAIGLAAAIGVTIDLAAVRFVPTGLAHLTGVAVGVLAGIALIGRAVTPVVRLRVELEDRYHAALADALTDQLTGLGNHRAFQEELDRQVAAAHRYEFPLALVLIDIDEFKTINDQGGHVVGDGVLHGFGQLLTSGVRRPDRPYRIGGDEFALLLPHTDADGARVLARRLLAMALQPPLREDGLKPVSFSAGISALPALADGRSRLYSQADAALYAAKRGGRTDVAVYDPTIEAGPADEGASAAVAEVIARGQLHPVYQPIMDVASGRVLGVEGLIRPGAATRFDDPAALFAAAEASGRLTTLDLACVEIIVAGARRLAPNQFLSVNLSPRTLEAGEFNTTALLGILARHRFPPERLVLELTEHQPLLHPERVRQKIEACRATGVRFAADDLGAGNAGLKLLSEIRFDILKVDLSLVQRTTPGAPSRAVVHSVVELAARTSALVIAEGVERQAELAQLLELGVGAAQGYYLGRPGPLIEAETSEQDLLGPMSAWRQSIGLPTTVG
jgi:diguanylate cyclase (GGDEF)-like protein